MPEYLLPDVGEGLTEAEIVAWKVKVGDEVTINQIVCDIETAKSIVELPSPFAGTVTAILVPEGETVAVGTPIIAIGDASAPPADPPAAAPGSNEPIDTNVPPEGNVTLVGYGPRETASKRRARKAPAAPPSVAGAAAQLQVQDAFATAETAPAPAPEVAEEPAVPATPAASASGRSVQVLAKPPVRKLAKDLGIDIGSLIASGPNGTVTREDVLAGRDGLAGRVASASERVEASVLDRPAGMADRREPIKGVRKMMAQAMVDSAFSAPHVTEWITVDVTRTMEFVERLKGRREFANLRVSPLLVLARACILAMRRTPEINTFWDAKAQEVVFKGQVNLGIAAATPRGLVVPNIKGAESMALPALAEALTQLIATARDGKTQPAEMSNGSFTITNVGVFGVDAGTPIINPGESAILAFGAVNKRPWVATDADGNDEIVVRQVTTLALSFDHRHIDGEKGSQFLADVAGILEDPASALLY